MRIEDISSWEAFLAVAKYGNFSNASRALNIAVPQLSKRVAKLESGLNIRLFYRSTRSVTLTNEGEALLPKVSSLIEDLEALEAQFSELGEISGTIKITCVPFLAHKFLALVIEDFMKIHPKVKIELELTKKFVNLIESGTDMAIRIEKPKDSELIYRRLAPNDLVFCATPKYLKACGEKIKKPEDLKNHDLLSLSIHNRCLFQNSDIKLGDFRNAKKIICEDGPLLTNMALNDCGILVRSIWDVQQELKEGRLVQLLKDNPLETFGNIHAVIPSKRYLAPRVRLFLDFILEKAASELAY